MLFRILFVTTLILIALELYRPRFVIAHVNLEWLLGLTIVGALFSLGRAHEPGIRSFGVRLILTLVLFAGSMVVTLRVFADLGRTGLVAAIASSFVIAGIVWMEIRKP